MPIAITIVDAFTSDPFRGNPAAVCVTDAPLESGLCQQIAAEMNLSETAFVTPRDGGFGLRWFTPEVEVPICGHATLASAHVLFETGQLASGATARFETRSGELRATPEAGWITLDFPRFESEPGEPPEVLRRVLGVDAVATARVRDDAMGPPNWIFELESEDAVRAAAPSFHAEPWPACAMITARAKSHGFDFVSRYFGPLAGIDEDPVTGAAHCALAPYWAARLGQTSFAALQLSRRGGEVRIELGAERVALRGRAVTVLRGTLDI